MVTHGSLESEAMADITPEAAGVVTEVRAEEGERVARGQVLAVLSSPSLEAGSERAKASFQARRRFEQSKVCALRHLRLKFLSPMPSGSKPTARHAARLPLTSPINWRMERAPG